MLSEVRQKKIMEKLNRAQKCSILGPQNLGSGGSWAPRPPLDLHLRGQIRVLNDKTTDLDWYHSRLFWKLKFLIRDLLFTTFVKNPPVHGGRGLCPGGVSVQGHLCPGASLSRGSPSRGLSVQGGSVRETRPYSKEQGA